MSDEIKNKEVQEENKNLESQENQENQENLESQEVESSEEKQEEEDIPTIQVDPETEFALKLQEFDRDIASSEAITADLKKRKMEYIYNSNVNLIVSKHKEGLIKAQTENEVRKKLAGADGKNA